MPVAEEVEEEGEEEETGLDVDDTIRGAVIHGPVPTRPTSMSSTFNHDSAHAIATPRPTLLFAIASDNVDEVRRVLESGEAGPDDDVGPQSALAFTLTAEQLKHKVEIVKLLLAHGANPASLKVGSGRLSRTSMSSEGIGSGEPTSTEGILSGVDPATRSVCAFLCL